MAGNYGGAWQVRNTYAVFCDVCGLNALSPQLQQLEFSQFKGPILMTSNCILEPRKSYKDRIFTVNAAGFPGVKHITGTDYSAVIDAALKSDGYVAPPQTNHTVLTGFGHNAILGVADKGARVVYFLLYARARVCVFVVSLVLTLLSQLWRASRAVRSSTFSSLAAAMALRANATTSRRLPRQCQR